MSSCVCFALLALSVLTITQAPTPPSTPPRRFLWSRDSPTMQAAHRAANSWYDSPTHATSCAVWRDRSSLWHVLAGMPAGSLSATVRVFAQERRSIPAQY